MDSKIGFEMSLLVVEGKRGRCESFMILRQRFRRLFGGQTNPAIFCIIIKDVYFLP